MGSLQKQRVESSGRTRGKAKGAAEMNVNGPAKEKAKGQKKGKEQGKDTENGTSTRRGCRPRHTYTALEPVEIVDERWWPEDGPEAFTQRVCEVRFGDGSVEQVLAEDVDGQAPLGDPLIDQNGLYSAVLEAWREHHVPPPYPGDDTDGDGDDGTVEVNSARSPLPLSPQHSSGDESEYVQSGDSSSDSSDCVE
jgi:hypothetical protein